MSTARNATAPMPQIQISSQSTILPPASAIMPSMRILQRPKSSSPAQSSPNSTPGSKSLQEREAEYKAARERIFASSGGEGGGSGSRGGSREGSPAPKRGIMTRARGGGGNGGRRGSSGGASDGIAGSGAVREPMGPQEGTRGFGSRGRRGRGASSDRQI